MTFEPVIMQILTFLMGISVFTSKSGISIFGLLLILFSFTPKNFALIKANKMMWLIASLFPIALITNAFSLAGSEAVFKVIQSWPWPLFAIPSAVIVARDELKKWLIRGLLLGLILALGKAFWNFYFINDLVFNAGVRTTSFWDVSRWGVFTGIAAVVLFWYLAQPVLTDKRRNGLLLVLLVLTLVALVLSGSRGPWVGTFVSLLILLFYSKRAKYLALGLLFLALLATALIPAVRERVESVVSVKSVDGKITSSDVSNAARLQMWKVAIEFYKGQPWFGTGLEMAEKPMREFLSSQSEEYRSQFVIKDFSFHDQHSTYLGLLVKMGLIFTAIFGAIIIFLTTRVIQNLFLSKFNWLILAVTAFHLVVFVFYTSFDSYEMISFFPLFVWGNLGARSALKPQS